MIKHFKILPFLIGLAVGYVLILQYHAPPQIILEYPHPQNVKDRVYRDNNGVCYRYNAVQVGCDKNEMSLRPYPLQA